MRYRRLKVRRGLRQNDMRRNEINDVIASYSSRDIPTYYVVHTAMEPSRAEPSPAI